MVSCDVMEVLGRPKQRKPNCKKIKEPLAKPAALVYSLLRKVIGMKSPIALGCKNDLE